MAHVLDEASGSSMDWVKATLGTKYVFGLELRPASAENNLGFIVSRNQIKPCGPRSVGRTESDGRER